MGKDAYYFSHDANARNDPKHIALRGKWGWQGYGWYWAIVEMMREEENYSLAIGRPYQCHALAIALETEVNTLEQFLDDCVDEYDLFERENGEIWSESLRRRLVRMEERREKLSAAGRKGAKRRWEDSHPIATPKPSDRVVVASDGKVKESKVKKSKGIYPPLDDLPKDESKQNSYPDRFELFWTAYPRKKDKGEAYKKWRTLVTEEGADPADLVTAAEHYAQEQSQQEERYIKLAPTFLAANKERWREYLEPPNSAEDDDYYKRLTPWVVGG